LSFDPSEFGTGYRRDAENFANLSATAKPFALTQTYAAPHSISHRSWRTAKNQGRVGSCTGFSRSSGEEILNYIATRGQRLEFSGMYAYLQNQKACGLYGQDVGATIDGSVRAAMETGICREETFPYPGRYVTGIPDAAIEEGKKHLIRSHSVMRSYDDVFAWLASGVGVVLIGIPWTNGLANAGATVEKRQAQGRGGGGHALVLEGYDGDKRDSQGRAYIDMENSHGPGYGERGFTLVSPETIDYLIGDGNAFIGISDLESYGPRQIVTFEGVFS